MSGPTAAVRCPAHDDAPHRAGVGFAVVQHLARRGATVYIAARSQDRAEDAIKRIRASGLAPGNGRIDHIELDLADPRTAKRAAETFLQKEERLDILSERSTSRTRVRPTDATCCSQLRGYVRALRVYP